MKRGVLATVVAMAFLVGARLSLAEDAKKDAEKITVTGVLSCQHCGKGFMKKDDPEKAAARHSASCSTSENCAKSGYMVISGKSSYALDKESAKMAEEYLKKENAVTRVTIVGTANEDKTLHATSIKAAEAEKKG